MRAERLAAEHLLQRPTLRQLVNELVQIPDLPHQRVLHVLNVRDVVRIHVRHTGGEDPAHGGTLSPLGGLRSMTRRERTIRPLRLPNDLTQNQGVAKRMRNNKPFRTSSREAEDAPPVAEREATGPDLTFGRSGT